MAKSRRFFLYFFNNLIPSAFINSTFKGKKSTRATRFYGPIAMSNFGHSGFKNLIKILLESTSRGQAQKPGPVIIRFLVVNWQTSNKKVPDFRSSANLGHDPNPSFGPDQSLRTVGPQSGSVAQPPNR